MMEPTPTRRDAEILILGAGPAGMLCALTAARRGLRPVLVDQGRQTGRKLRASGGGRSNCTNRDATPGHYLCGDPRFTARALAQFPPARFLSLLAELGLRAHEEDHGRMFCDQGATALCEALEKACRKAGCRFLLGRSVTALTAPWEPRPAVRDNAGEDAAARAGTAGLYTIHTDQGPLCAPKVVLALGSPAWPALGGTDIVARLAGGLGLPHAPARPALTPFELSGPALALCRELAGLSLTARVALAEGGREYTDGLLFTHQGLSGPAALQISSHWRRGQELRVDLAPEVDMPAFLRAPERAKKQARAALCELLPRRLAEALLAGLPPGVAERRLAELSRADLDALARLASDWRVTPKGTAGMARAEAASGGLLTDAFSPKTMRCKPLPGLYAVGEALDVAGELGGYNLHWAWASGFAAGQAL